MKITIKYVDGKGTIKTENAVKEPSYEEAIVLMRELLKPNNGITEIIIKK